uniref:CIDE-N domain-containing protein n=1 Tax=Leptobrachium leishanense TaxID=445787 RepID=A0A8C5LZ53_9ANUR
MAVVGGPDRLMADYKKECLVCVRGSKEWHGVAASSLQELLEKAYHPVLTEDGTIVEDEDCFLCLLPKAKLMVLTGNKKWAAPSTVDGGTAWLAQESLVVQDNMDDIGDLKWKVLAAQLNENLSNIILMSESELQMLEEVKQSTAQVQVLQDTLQRGGTAPLRLHNQAMREKELPPLGSSNIEAVTSEDPDAVALIQDTQRAADLQSDCRRELENRTQHALSRVRERRSRTFPLDSSPGTEPEFAGRSAGSFLCFEYFWCHLSI